MPSDRGVPHSGRLGKGRMEAFSDGVFSIAATLLVLDIAVHPPGSALDQVLEAWPTYVAYVVSFLTIGGGWLGHTALTDRIEHVDPLLLRINLLLLMVVAFLPFPPISSPKVSITLMVNASQSPCTGQRSSLSDFWASPLTGTPSARTSTDEQAKEPRLNTKDDNSFLSSPATSSRSSSDWSYPEPRSPSTSHSLFTS